MGKFLKNKSLIETLDLGVFMKLKNKHLYAKWCQQSIDDAVKKSTNFILELYPDLPKDFSKDVVLKYSTSGRFGKYAHHRTDGYYIRVVEKKTIDAAKLPPHHKRCSIPCDLNLSYTCQLIHSLTCRALHFQNKWHNNHDVGIDATMNIVKYLEKYQPEYYKKYCDKSIYIPTTKY